MDDIERSEHLFRDRRERFNRILDGYELSAGDWKLVSQPKRSREEAMRMHPQPRINVVDSKHVKPGRWVLITESSRGHGYFAENVEQQEALGHAAVANLHEGWQPVCYFDLDTLAGDEPLPDIGDLVCVLQDDLRTPVEGDTAGTWFVVDHNGTEDDGDGAYRKCDLAREADGRPRMWHDSDHLTVLERAVPDERMPVRYGLAKIVTVAVFNTIPSP